MNDTNEFMPRDKALSQLRQVRKEFTEYFEKLKELYSTDEVICDLMTRRGYTNQKMYDTLKDVGLFKVDVFSDVVYHPFTQSFDTHNLWGLTDNSGVTHLSGRYIVPIRDIQGYVTALVGWYPDSRKYITTPTFGFARDAQFFNIEEYAKYPDSESVFLVEGIFDTLSLRSQNVFALGNMGLDLSSCKVKLLGRFGHVYAIADADKAGQSVLPHRKNKRKWAIPNCTFVRLKLDGVKDVDDALKYFDLSDDLSNLVTKQGYLSIVQEC